ncbi:TetR/AcrR family transcriptional regulator [Weissella viridescens]|uniref:TetR/AcrR family transcriptional regulator n=1 Tax=Weissella viridescens TaxID=1629 RepID=A0A3P2RJ90_WEIVI|nr:TetR/AcrR family transcriptional regulator [Weissella viridescens]RRG18810.1 TetR/AcrR family transcriptional regulator [Weissella viridescens]
MPSQKVKKTRQNLLDACIQLLAQQDLNQISVTDIVEQAQVHRATFYRHFEDKYDLLNQAENEIFDEMATAFKQYISDEPNLKIDTTSFADYRLALLKIFMKHAPFINAMLGTNGDLTFENKLYDRIYQLTQLGFQTLYNLPQSEAPKAEFIGHYAASAAFGVVRQWLKKPTSTPNELAQLLDELTIKGIASTLNELTP